MSITHELRGFADDWDWLDPKAGESPRKLRALADRIDAEHKKACDDAWDNGYEADYLGIEKWLTEHPQVMEHHGWVRLPKDANGEVIHMGDEVYQVEGGWVYTVESIRFYPDNTTVTFSCKHGFGCDSAHNVRHYHAPTVEDVLREFADIVRKERVELATISEDTIAEYAARLRLAEGEDA